MSDFYFSPIKDVLGVQVNDSDFRYSYGQAMPEATKQEFDESLIKLEIEYVDDRKYWSETNNDGLSFHYFSGRFGEDWLEYVRPFLFGSRLGLSISGLRTNHVKIRVNKSYKRFVKHRFMNLHSVGYIATDITNLKLLDNGYCPLHCSAIDVDGDAYVIFAPPNTGKTLSSMQLCMNDPGIRFVAEDLAATDGVYIYAAPWTSTFRYYSNVDRSRSNQLRNWLTSKVALLELVQRGEVEQITKYIPEDRICHKAPIKGLFILERGEKGVEEVSVEEAKWRVAVLNRYEFNHMRAPAILAYEYFNYSSSVEKALSTEDARQVQMLETADFIKIVRSNNPTDYAELIAKII